MAKTNWRDFLSWDESNVSDVRCIGYAYIRQGKYDIALKIFKALEIIDKGYSYDIEVLGAIYLELDDASNSLVYLEKALKTNPGNPTTLLNQARALFTLGQREKGLRIAKKLSKNKNKLISDRATALALAFGG